MERKFRYRELKKKDINEKQPIFCRIPVYLLSEIKEYGQTGKVITKALRRTHSERFTFDLRELSVELQKRMADLEQWEREGPVFDEGIIGSYHLKLLELYRHLYFSIIESKLLKKPMVYDKGSLIKTKKK